MDKDGGVEVTWSPAGGDLDGAQVVWRLVRGRADEIEVEAVVSEFQELHEQTMLTFIVQVQVLSRRLQNTPVRD